MKEIDYKSLTVNELVKQLSPSSPVVEELTKRGVIRNRNYTGNIGEYFAIEFFIILIVKIIQKLKISQNFLDLKRILKISMQKMEMEKGIV